MRVVHRLTPIVLFGVACSSDPVTSAESTSGSSSSTTGSASTTSTGVAAETGSDATTSTGDDPIATVRRTKHGVVHVEADTYFGIGYGVAHAYTEDNRCLLAYRLEEVQGRLAAQLGADAPVTHAVHDTTVTALQSDRFYRGWFDDDEIRAGFEAGAPEVLDLADGYAAGINRYLADHPEERGCEVELTADVSREAMFRLWVAAATVGSGEAIIGQVANGPPTASAATTNPTPSPLLGTRLPFGSNAWALGRDATRSGASLHLYNPHFPWRGSQRVYVVHVTIPGELDVMGAALGGFPLPAAGFTRSVAWGLTFSNAARHTMAELVLDDDPLHYVVDGERQNIDVEMHAIEVAGEPEPRQIPFYRAQGRPLIHAPLYSMPWSAQTAFAVHDVNATNTRMVEQLLRIAQTESVEDVRESLSEIQGIPWSYVLASDIEGGVLFGDISAVPNVTREHAEDCVTTPTGMLLRSFGLLVFDGTRLACDWSGVLPASAAPWVVRSDYVANSNNSYEVPHPAERLTDISPVFGPSGAGLSLRANLGLNMVEDRLAGADGLGEGGFTPTLAKDVFFGARNRAGELLADGIVAECRATPVGVVDGVEVDLSGVCTALDDWDRRNTVASPGAAVFRGLWMAMEDPEQLFAVPASIAEPLTTPSGFTEDAERRAAVRDALARVAVAFEARGLDPTVAWGVVNAVTTPSGPMPMPGGLGSEGIFDVNVSADAFYSFDGWLETLDGIEPSTLFGASYLHVVELDENGPHAQGVLPYSQATEPDSPWYLDQVERWSANDWFDFPFTSEAIEADPDLMVLEL